MRGGDSHYYREHIVYRPTDAETIAQHCRSAGKASNRRLLAMVRNDGLEKRSLDIGSGFGAFVHFALSQGIDAYGIDFNDEQVHAGQTILGLGDRLFCGDVKELRGKIGSEEQFDLLTLFEVIEHVENPLDLIRNAADLLKTGGLLVLSCPNESRWQPTGRIFVDYPPHHLTRWRPDTLRNFLESQGFKHERTEIETSLRDLFWVVYVNRSARRKMDARKDHPGGQDVLESSYVRKAKMTVFDLMKIFCYPFDLILKFSGIGTMGMRIIVKKI